MGFQEIIYTKADGIATITFNRPDRLNALTQSMRIEILDAIGDASADDGVRVVVFEGAGKAFCAGADLGPQPNQTRAKPAETRNSGLPRDGFQETFARIMWDLPKPARFSPWHTAQFSLKTPPKVARLPRWRCSDWAPACCSAASAANDPGLVRHSSANRHPLRQKR